MICHDYKETEHVSNTKSIVPNTTEEVFTSARSESEGEWLAEGNNGWRQLQNALQVHSTQVQILWNISGIFWAGQGLLLVGLIKETGSKTPPETGIVISLALMQAIRRGDLSPEDVFEVERKQQGKKELRKAVLHSNW